jgi:hypothetical protein
MAACGAYAAEGCAQNRTKLKLSKLRLSAVEAVLLEGNFPIGSASQMRGYRARLPCKAAK